MELLSTIVIYLGAVFILFGAIGILRFRCFPLRLLIVAKIDTVGAITVVIGVALRHGLSFFTLRAVLLLVILLIINPMVGYIIARTAHASGHQMEEKRPE